MMVEKQGMSSVWRDDLLLEIFENTWAGGWLRFVSRGVKMKPKTPDVRSHVNVLSSVPKSATFV